MNWELIDVMLSIIERAMTVIEGEIEQEQDDEFTDEVFRLTQALGELSMMAGESRQQ